MNASDPTFTRDLTNHWLRFGPAALVQKVGRKWSLGYSDEQWPVLFNTKREAMEQADRWVLALGREASA